MTTETFNQNSASALRSLLIGRQITAAEDDTLTLDDGTLLKVLPNYGCGGCASGNYEIKALDTFDQVITNVKLVDEETSEGDPSWSEEPHIYSIFVYAGRKTYGRTILSVTGDDGNGYYGTGYEIQVTRP